MTHQDNISIGVYRIVVNVLIGTTCLEAIKSSKELKKVFWRKGEKPFWDNMHGAYMHSEKHNYYTIVLAEDAGLETIAHEAFHCTHGVLRHVGLKFSNKSEEAFAYVHGHLVNELSKVMANYKTKKRKHEKSLSNKG